MTPYKITRLIYAWLKRLDIDEHSRSIRDDKREMLYGIKLEVLCGFSNRRTPYDEPSLDEDQFSGRFLVKLRTPYQMAILEK